MPEIKYFKELNSTNTYALEHFNDLKNYTIITADVQTSGRGRFNRVWEGKSSENIYMTIVLKPKDNQNYPYMNLTQYLSVVVNRVFNRDLKINSKIKWPNDILYKGKKISGILSEAKADKGQIQGVVLGIGINVNAEKDFYKDLPQAITLKEITGSQTDKNKLFKMITNEFFKNIEEFETNGFHCIMEEYRAMCQILNGKIKITASTNNGEFDFVSINDDGTLTVKNQENELMKIVSGDILC